jgi:hypothetical protein
MRVVRGVACLSLQRERQAWREAMFRERLSTGIISEVRSRVKSGRTLFRTQELA